MPSFSRPLEETLHRAVGYANARRHEYATLEHLLLALAALAVYAKGTALRFGSRSTAWRDSLEIAGALLLVLFGILLLGGALQM